MKLEIVKPERKLTKGIPVLSILKNGCFNFSTMATEKLQFIQLNSRIGFFQDKESPTEWYIVPSVDGHTINRSKKSKSGKYVFMQFQSASLRYSIMQSLEVSDNKPIRFRIATEPTEWNGNMFHALMLLK